jgi:UDP-N-acetylglucosamine--N-acetylmuramyl-(pentapeptide) pyrophosphoryl-undecaprenol N-acetylglucosamine transferase
MKRDPSPSSTARASAPTVVLAAGGTGGHVFPGLAVADALTKLADVRVVFFGTPRGLESTVVPERGYELELLEAQPLQGVTPSRALLALAVAGRETTRAVLRLARHKPRVVLSIGGYAAGPVSLAAVALRVPLALHEPNSVAGLANRIVAPLAREAYVAWPETRLGTRERRHVGVPLRSRFEPSLYKPRGTARLLVLGGSQGASALNDRMPEVAARLRGAVPGLEIVHQTGRDRERPVARAYEREGVSGARVVPFLEDVAAELREADLVVARAGAVTVAEIAAVGRAAVFVPFPHAADDHQAKNAEALAAKGAALSIRQEAADVVRLASEIQALLQDDARRVAMADAARAHGRPEAARVLASQLLKLARISPRPVSSPRQRNGSGHSRDLEVS